MDIRDWFQTEKANEGKKEGGGEDKHKKGDKNEKPIIQKVVEKREWDRDNKAK